MHSLRQIYFFRFFFFFAKPMTGVVFALVPQAQTACDFFVSTYS